MGCSVGYRYAYHDDPLEDVEESKSLGSRVLYFFSALAIIAVAGTTFASNISLNNSSSTEFGQGFLGTTACSGSTNLLMKPTTIFDGSNYLLKSVTISNIPSQCVGNDLTLNAYSTPVAPNGSIGFTNVGSPSPYLLTTVTAPGATSTTYEWWFYNTSSSPATQGMLQTRTNAMNSDGFDVSVEGGGITISNGSGFFMRSVGAFQINKWNHMAVVRNGTTTWTAYLNGTSIGTFSFSGSTGTTLAIGAKSFATYNEYFNGYISNFRYVKGTAVYTANFTPPTSMLPNISGTQLLLNTAFDASYLNDSSGNNVVVTKVSGTPVSVNQSPYPLTSTTLALFNTSYTSATVYMSGAGFVQGSNSVGTTVSSLSSPPSGSFTVAFDTPTALASAVQTLTLQSAPHS
jgi:hypothetical protein